MMLYIMRHGLAEEPTPKGDDSARKLTSKGVDKIRKAAAGMRAMGLAFNVILTSPITRAMETAEIVAGELGGSKPRAMPELSTGASPAGLLEAIVKLKLPESVLVVGHEPTLSRLASLMLTGSSESAGIKLKQGGVIALEFPDRVERGAAQLRWMMTQRQLRQHR
ncbi:MAG TPA: phosphohistidine phosphatase SixA [Candidatus Binataceae bacterium]|nr:phosphohistidine phosphatase SixA [Candidatus Binataceae bacterium]